MLRISIVSDVFKCCAFEVLLICFAGLNEIICFVTCIDRNILVIDKDFAIQSGKP